MAESLAKILIKLIIKLKKSILFDVKSQFVN
jgi:hypothetical protein